MKPDLYRQNPLKQRSRTTRYRLSLAIILLWVSLGSSSRGDVPLENNSAPVTESAIATLAKMNWQVDPPHISTLLKLPNLERDMKWYGPFSGNQEPDFFANYTPPDSELGISGISIRWQIILSRSKSQILKNLSIGFVKGRCPSVSALETAMKTEPVKVGIQSPHGGPLLNKTVFFVQQNYGDPIQVSYHGDNTCGIDIGRISDH